MSVSNSTEVENINDFDPSLLNIDEVSFRDDELVMHDIKYIKNLNGLNTLYLVFNNLDVYFKKSDVDKYLFIASTEKKQNNVTKLRRIT